MSQTREKSYGNTSNLQADIEAHPGDELDADLVAQDQDNVTAGMEWELGQMTKRDPTLAKQRVLARLKQDPHFYQNLDQFKDEPEEENPNLVPPSPGLGSSDSPALNDGFDPLSAGPHPSATEGHSEENPYGRWNDEMRSKGTGLGFLKETFYKRYGKTCRVETRGAAITVKRNDYQVAIAKVKDQADRFAILAQKNGKEVLYEIANRKTVFGVLDRLFPQEKIVRVNVLGVDGTVTQRTIKRVI
jgi:hypothetical protein